MGEEAMRLKDRKMRSIRKKKFPTCLVRPSTSHISEYETALLSTAQPHLAVSELITF